MMVCSKAMINVARKMEERYGIPFFEGSFYGIEDSSDSLREIARLLIERGAPDELMARTEAVIAREEAKAWAAIERLQAALQGQEGSADHRRRQVLVGGRGLAGGGPRARRHQRQEIDREDKERIKEIMGQDAHMIDDMTPREMYKMLKDARADIMLSGGRSQFIALKASMPWLDINQERHHAYMGYVGMVEAGRGDRQGALQPGVGAGAQAGALGRAARRPGRPGRSRRWKPRRPSSPPTR